MEITILFSFHIFMKTNVLFSSIDEIFNEEKMSIFEFTTIVLTRQGTLQLCIHFVFKGSTIIWHLAKIYHNIYRSHINLCYKTYWNANENVRVKQRRMHRSVEFEYFLGENKDSWLIDAFEVYRFLTILFLYYRLNIYIVFK